MPSPSRKILRPAPAQAALRIGFIALNDAAPIIVAQEHGLFKKHGLTVTLSREVGWATIRDKVIHHELDAAHALGAMLISTPLGINCLPTECLTALVLNTNGNCITLSEELWRRGVRDARSLREEIVRSRHERTYVFELSESAAPVLSLNMESPPSPASHAAEWHGRGLSILALRASRACPARPD